MKMWALGLCPSHPVSFLLPLGKWCYPQVTRLSISNQDNPPWVCTHQLTISTILHRHAQRLIPNWNFSQGILGCNKLSFKNSHQAFKFSVLFMLYDIIFVSFLFTVFLKKISIGTEEMTQWFKSTACSFRVSEFKSQYPHGSSLLSVTPLPGLLTPSYIYVGKILTNTK